MNKKANILFSVFFILSLVLIIFIYKIDNKNQELTIPKTLTNYEIETNIKAKISNRKEQDFVLSQYPKTGQIYILDHKITTENKNKIKNILTENGYFIDLTERGIETPIKKIINGYLGQFFRFKYFNNINWLVIPIIFYIIFTFKKRTKKELALVLFYILGSVLIAVKGYINFRYSLTLLPITLIIIFYYGYEIINKKQFKKFKKPLSILLIVFLVFNGIKYNIGFIEQTQQYLKKNTDQNNNHTQDQKSINETVKFINSLKLPPNTKILNNNIPFLYYYTNKPAVYYLAELDTYYTETGSKALTLGIPLTSLGNFIKNELKCDYILSSHSHNQYNLTFKKFLETETDLVFESGDFVIYKIKDKKI